MIKHNEEREAAPPPLKSPRSTGIGLVSKQDRRWREGRISITSYISPHDPNMT